MSQIVLYVIIFFSLLGAIDKLLGNKFGLGAKFEEGFKGMGSLAMTMIGIYCLSPVIAHYFLSFLLSLSRVTGADPSIFIGSILACDMGGYTAAVEIAANEEIAKFSGIILASMMGATISFTIPIATNILSKEDFDYFAKGVLSGIVTIPVGCLIGGLAMGLGIRDIFMNIIPIVVLSVVIAVCLVKIKEKIVKLFVNIGKVIFVVSLVGLILSILNFVLGINILPGMIPFEEGIVVVGKIAVILSGAYPLIYFLSKVLEKGLSSLSEKLGVNDISILGLITSLANNVPTLGILKDMDWKGKIVNSAFAVSGAFTFGGQLGFVSGVSEDVVIPFILAKLAAGFSGILVAIFFIKLEEKNKKSVI